MLETKHIVTIDRNEWYRGKDPAASRLLNSKNNTKCCLGFLCLSGGIDISCITDLGYPAQVSNYYSLGKNNGILGKNNSNYITNDILNILTKYTGYAYGQSVFAQKAIYINDTFVGECYGKNEIFEFNRELIIKSEAHREQLLSELFLTENIEINFVN